MWGELINRVCAGGYGGGLGEGTRGGGVGRGGMGGYGGIRGDKGCEGRVEVGGVEEVKGGWEGMGRGGLQSLWGSLWHLH